MPAPTPSEWAALTDDQQLALATTAIGIAESNSALVSTQRADLDALTKALSDLRTSTAADVAALTARLDTVTRERDALLPPPDPERVAWDDLPGDDARFEDRQQIARELVRAGEREQAARDDRRADRREVGRIVGIIDGPASGSAQVTAATAELLTWARDYGITPRAGQSGAQGAGR